MAGLPDDFNEDDFEDYNPHPYLGGYDIVKTYGQPLNPSSEICYPISSPIGSSSPVQKPDPAQSRPVKESDLPDPAESRPVKEYDQPDMERPADPPVIEQSRSEPHQYSTYDPVPYKPDLFRSWPFSHSEYSTCKGKRGEVLDRDYWHQYMKGLDFLFGHSEGFGERRVGTDIYGIPIYASRKSGTESVLVREEMGVLGKVEFCEGQNENESVCYNNEYCTDYYNYEQHNSSYTGASENWGYKNEGSLYYAEQEESREENSLINAPILSYNQHYYENPLQVQVKPYESTWTQSSISHENYPSYNEKYEENYEKPYQSYEAEQYRYESLEPFNPSWSQNLGYYHNNLEGEPIASDHNYHGNESSQYEYTKDSSYYENNQTWSDNNQVSYGDDISQKSDWVDHHSYKLTDSIFGTFQNYYAYDQ